MIKNLKNITVVFLAMLTVTLFSGCEATKNASNEQKGAVIGTASGAVLGAILGNNVGSKDNAVLGAVIGGVVGGTAGVLIGRRMDQQAQEIEKEIPGAKVERIDDAIVLTFDEASGVHFATNKSDLTATSRQNLNKLSEVLKDYEDTNILVVGHTDSTGPYEFNMTLSRDRAMTVSNYLIERGVAANRITTEWYGPDKPVADNSTVEGRAKNRRVNIAIVPNEEMKEQAIKEAGEN